MMFLWLKYVFTIDGTVQRKMQGRSVAAAGKGINLVISNDDMGDIIRIIKSLENLDVLIELGKQQNMK